MRRRAVIVLLAGLVAALAAAAPAPAAYAPAGSFGGPGDGPGGFGPGRADYQDFRMRTSPGGIAFDRAGNLFVADSLHDRIQRFTPGGRYLGAFGRRGITPGSMLSPQGVVFQGGRLYVANNANDRVDTFSAGGRFQDIFSVPHPLSMFYGLSRGAAYGQLDNPFGMARTRSGYFYVADLNNSRVNRYTSRGRPRGQIGSFGTGPGQFLAPYGVAVDAGGNVYVSDRELNRIQKFSPSGRLLAAWGASGSDSGEFMHPLGLAVDRSGNVYVADQANYRIQKFTSSGAFLESFGEGTLRWPNFVAVDAGCRVYVSDYRRVVTFAPTSGC
jgi:DNA-binding beta-propeller fold protein YncE